MKKMMVSAALAFLMVACGGGGGGGAPAPVGGTPEVAGDGGTGLVLATVAPSQVRLELFEGERVPDVSLSVKFTGDKSPLYDDSVDFFSIVSDPLFDQNPKVIIEMPAAIGEITFHGVVPPNGPKTYVNNITVRACLDVDCQTQYGSTFQVPYTVVVKKGLTVGAEKVDLKTTFGTFPAPITVPVGLPDGTESWTVQADGVVIDAVKSVDGKGIVVSARRLYAADELSGREPISIIRLVANVPGFAPLIREVPVYYTTGPSSVPYVLSQTHSKFSIRLNWDDQVGDDFVQFYSGTTEFKYRVHFIGNEYILKPAGASFAGFPEYSGGWLVGYLYDSGPNPPWWQARALACYKTNCLPAGHYTVKSRYAVTTDGVNELEVLEYTAELDIIP